MVANNIILSCSQVCSTNDDYLVKVGQPKCLEKLTEQIKKKSVNKNNNN